MTGQIEDTYRYKGKEHSIIAMTTPIEFDPEEYGFHPEAPHTACWRGYVCHYDIVANQLALTKLEIFCGENPYPVFDGVAPVKDRRKWSNMMIYRNLRHVIDYDGSIVVGSGFLNQYYIHMGFQRAWAYENVYELMFEHGKVIKTVDHSDFVQKFRDEIKRNPDFLKELHSDIPRFIDDSFSRDARIKAWWL